MPTVVAEGLQFPEGPAFDSQGNLFVVEIEGGRITRIAPDGTVSVFAETGGGPNGQAFGPDGALYVCNNGGLGDEPAEPGRVERISPDGTVTVLITEIDGEPLARPNDIVFDALGNFYFTNPHHGGPGPAQTPPGDICYSDRSGSARRVHTGLRLPNGIGISEDETTLIVTESRTGKVHGFPVLEPGALGAPRELGYLGDGQGPPDGLAIDAEGYLLCCGPRSGRIHVFPPGGGEKITTLQTEDWRVTNVCFGGPEFKTLYATESNLGRVVSLEWVRPGLRLAPDS